MSSHKKPTGELGSFSLGLPGGPEFRSVKFPSSKPEIEDFVLRQALEGFKKQQLQPPWLAIPERNQENHFDYTIPVHPPEYLDLMEIAPLPQTGGYKATELHRSYGDLADEIWSALTQKALRYGRPGVQKIHILGYITDFAFDLFPDLLQILSYYLSISDRGLSSVTYAVPSEDGVARVQIIHPVSRDAFIGFSLRRARSRHSRVGDPTGAVIDPDGGLRFSFPLRRKGTNR